VLKDIPHRTTAAVRVEQTDRLVDHACLIPALRYVPIVEKDLERPRHIAVVVGSSERNRIEVAVTLNIKTSVIAIMHRDIGPVGSRPSIAFSTALANAFSG